jgi:hypothetical protein
MSSLDATQKNCIGMCEECIAKNLDVKIQKFDVIFFVFTGPAFYILSEPYLLISFSGKSNLVRGSLSGGKEEGCAGQWAG